MHRKIILNLNLHNRSLVSSAFTPATLLHPSAASSLLVAPAPLLPLPSPDAAPSSHGRRAGAALQARRPSPRRGPLSARPLLGVALWVPPPSAPPLPDTALLGASLTVRRPSRAQPSRRAGPPEHGGSGAPSQPDIQICSSKCNHIRAVAAPSAASFQWPR